MDNMNNHEAYICGWVTGKLWLSFPAPPFRHVTSTHTQSKHYRRRRCPSGFAGFFKPPKIHNASLLYDVQCDESTQKRITALTNSQKCTIMYM